MTLRHIIVLLTIALSLLGWTGMASFTVAEGEARPALEQGILTRATVRRAPAQPAKLVLVRPSALSTALRPVDQTLVVSVPLVLPMAPRSPPVA